MIAELPKINKMYMYSLNYFISYFESQITLIRDSADNAETKIVIPQLIYLLTVACIQNICNGLFNRDKQIFNFMVLS